MKWFCFFFFASAALAQDITFTNRVATFTNLQGSVYRDVTLVKGDLDGVVWREGAGGGRVSYTNLSPALLETWGIPTNRIENAHARALRKAAADAQFGAQPLSQGPPTATPWTSDPGWQGCERAIQKLSANRALLVRQHSATVDMVRAKKATKQSSTTEQARLADLGNRIKGLDADMRKYRAEQDQIAAGYRLREASKKP